MKKMKTINANGIFAGDNYNYDVIQEEDGFLIKIGLNGLYKTVNKYFYLKPFFEAYGIEYKAGNKIECEVLAPDKIKIFGERKKIMWKCPEEYLTAPDKFPCFSSVVKQSEKLPLKVSEYKIIEKFNYADFQFVIYRDWKDKFAPKYKELAQVFGLGLKHLAKPYIRFAADETTPDFGSTLGDDVVYCTASNGDVIACKRLDMPRLFKVIDITEVKEIYNNEGELGQVVFLLKVVNDKLERSLGKVEELTKDIARLKNENRLMKEALFMKFNSDGLLADRISEMDYESSLNFDMDDIEEDIDLDDIINF